MRALISPIEQANIGYRIAEIHKTGFEVAEPLFWVECFNNLVVDEYYYDPLDNIIKTIPKPQPITPIGDAPNVIA